ncbi:MAG: M20/M25/M40 family metallo-hydrolase [Chloroflexi bacterium]|nr:M20/M25/M40 family metallo-hydrolase [Chloroflexota bacterium]
MTVSIMYNMSQPEPAGGWKMIDQERLVNSFCELVKIDSPSDEEEEVARYLTGRLEGLGFTVERDAHGNLIASEEGADPLMLSAHMDTVEPGRGIKPEVQGDRIVSDGTTILGGDCKAGVAAILEGLESIALDGGLRRPVQVVLTRGEEIGLVGAANLDYSMIRCRDAVVFDGNGPVNTITGASPTYMRFDVNIMGRGAHAGVEPEKGLSAIRIATDIINELPQGRLDEETTFNVGLITGGTVRNAVPVEASFGGEFRSHNTETIDLLRMQVRETMRRAREKYRDATIQEELEMMFQMYLLDPNEAIVQLVTKQLRDMALQPNIHPSGGGTDANAMRLNGVECVVVGMATNEMHTVNEYVVIPDIMATAQFCQNILTINQRARA